MNKEIEVKTKNVELKMVTPDQEKLVKGAVDLVNYFSGQGLMLPVTLENYTTLASKNALVVAKSVNGDVVGTASYSQFYPGGVWEFGGWAVAKECQGLGMGVKLMKVLFSNNTHYQTIAFGNKNSGPIFESLGALVVEDHVCMPKAIFEPCAICPNKPASGCCDTVYNLEPIVSGFVTPDLAKMSPRQIDRLVYGLGESQSSEFKGFGKSPVDWD